MNLQNVPTIEIDFSKPLVLTYGKVKLINHGNGIVEVFDACGRAVATVRANTHPNIGSSILSSFALLAMEEVVIYKWIVNSPDGRTETVEAATSHEALKYAAVSMGYSISSVNDEVWGVYTEASLAQAMAMPFV